MRPVVIGGGFAGLSAACRLADRGLRPLLLERAPRPGGRASSFHDPEIAETVDFGQHVLMACCTATVSLLRRIGTEDAVSFQRDLAIPILHAGRRTALRSRRLPGALHFAPALLGYGPLTPRERCTALRAGLSLLHASADALEEIAFGDWLAAHRQRPEAVARLWDPICIAALNARAADVSAAAAHKVFVDAFFRPGAANLGLFTRPLADVAESLAAHITARGGTAEVGRAVERLEIERDAVRGVVLRDGSEIEAGNIISAVTPEDLLGLLPAGVEAETVLGEALALQWAPIINVHLWFDGPVLEDPFAVAVDAPIQTAFDVTRIHGGGSPPGGTHIVVSHSAAGDWMSRSDEEIVDIACGALASLDRGGSPAHLLRARVLRQPRATFVASPGSSRRRPCPCTSIHGLVLAGDWTATGWPSTLESAVRSGEAAALQVA